MVLLKKKKRERETTLESTDEAQMFLLLVDKNVLQKVFPLDIHSLCFKARAHTRNRK